MRTPVQQVSDKIVETLDKEISPGLMLSKEDEIAILLASAYGVARSSGFHREKLEAIRAQTWAMLDDVRGPWPKRPY